MHHDRLAGAGRLAVAAGLRGEVDDHGARLHRGEHGLGDEPRRRLARDLRRGDDEVDGGQDLADRLEHLLLLLLRQLLRVAAGALGRGADRLGLDEGGAEALHLLAHRGPHVEGGDDGAEPARGGDRLQPGDAGTEDEHAAGASVPAAVVSIGRSFASSAAPRSTAL